MNGLVVLDIGHGNCSILRVDNEVAVVDIANYAVLAEYLDGAGIDTVEHLVISHADADHLSGAAALLTDDRAKHVYANPDSTKRSAAFDEFRRAVAVAVHNGNVTFHPIVTARQPLIRMGTVDMRVLSPDVGTALSGPGGMDLDGQSLDSNSMSAVLLISVDGENWALLPGDIDSRGWDRLLAIEPQPRAKLLVFPHHGGRTGRSDDQEFGRKVAHAVQPEVIVFSIGRGMHRTPRPEVISGIRAVSPTVRIACTQLSQHCAADDIPLPQDHLSPLAALGKRTARCCAGTLVFPVSPYNSLDPDPAAHRLYLGRLSTPLCLATSERD